MLGLLGWACCTDVRYWKIPNFIPIGVGLVSLWAFVWGGAPIYPYSFLWTFVVLILLSYLLGSFHNKKKILPIVLGGGDVKLMSCCSLFLHSDQISVWFMLIGACGVLTAVVCRQRCFPLAPAIALSFFIIWDLSPIRMLIDKII